jgi:hypothetical protein
LDLNHRRCIEICKKEEFSQEFRKNPASICLNGLPLRKRFLEVVHGAFSSNMGNPHSQIKSKSNI